MQLILDAEFLHQPTGGRPGGFAQFVDGLEANGNFITAPSKFLGDWTRFGSNPSLTYDFQQFDAGTGNLALDYEVVISGPGGQARYFQPNPNTTGTWNRVTVPINEPDWNVENGSWPDLIRDVTDLSVRIEHIDNNTTLGDIAGIDNISITQSNTAGSSFGASFDVQVSDQNGQLFSRDFSRFADLPEQRQNANLDIDLDASDGSLNLTVDGSARIARPGFKAGVAIDYDATLTPEVGITRSEINARTTFNDLLVATGDFESVAESGDLVFTVRANGRFTLENSLTNPNQSLEINTSVSFGTEENQFAITRQFQDGKPTDEDVDLRFQFTRPLTDSQTITLDIESEGTAQTTGGVLGYTYQFGRTFEIESILFQDGTTPESRGITLDLASGFSSPNIPEPSSLLLAAIGLFLAPRQLRVA